MREKTVVPRATLGRLPQYLRYLRRTAHEQKTVSATVISRALGYGEVQVRKDLCAVSGAGKPRIGYVTEELIESIDRYLTAGDVSRAVIVGAGKLGGALLDYDGFSDFGIDIVAAFDANPAKCGLSSTGKAIRPVDDLFSFCRTNQIRVGVITVPESVAQSVCDLLVAAGVRAVWSFAPGHLTVPAGTVLREENLALSLAHLRVLSGEPEC